MRSLHFLAQKNFGFYEIYMVCLHGQGWGSPGQPVRTFCGQGGQFFAIYFVRTSLMDGRQRQIVAETTEMALKAGCSVF